MIKNIVFDLGGVVIPLTPETAWQRFEQLGIKDTRQQMGLYGQTGIFLQLENGSITTDQFLKELADMAQEQSHIFDDQEPRISFQQAQRATPIRLSWNGRSRTTSAVMDTRWTIISTALSIVAT